MKKLDPRKISTAFQVIFLVAVATVVVFVIFVGLKSF